MIGLQPQLVVHFLHLGKTGGTAIKHVLKSHWAQLRHPVRLRHHDITLRDVPPGEKVFFFVRDPITRFVSGFYSRQRQGQPRYVAPWTPEERDAFEAFSTPNALALALSSVDEPTRSKAEAAMRSIQHVRSSYWDWFDSEPYFHSRLTDVWFIGFQESLAGDFALLRARLGLPDTAELPTDVNAHRNPPGLDRSLDEAATANLRLWYAADYRFVALCRQIRQRTDQNE